MKSDILLIKELNLPQDFFVNCPTMPLIIPDCFTMKNGTGSLSGHKKCCAFSLLQSSQTNQMRDLQVPVLHL